MIFKPNIIDIKTHINLFQYVLIFKLFSPLASISYCDEVHKTILYIIHLFSLMHNNETRFYFIICPKWWHVYNRFIISIDQYIFHQHACCMLCLPFLHRNASLYNVVPWISLSGWVLRIASRRSQDQVSRLAASGYHKPHLMSPLG